MDKLSEEELYKVARRRVSLKRDFYSHLLIYIVVNAFLALINFTSGNHYPWCLWVLFGWGIGVVSYGIDTYVKLTDNGRSVEKEMQRLKEKGL